MRLQAILDICKTCVLSPAPAGPTPHVCFVLLFSVINVYLSVSGGPSQWPVGGTADTPLMTAPVSTRTAGTHSESSEDQNSEISLHCSY